MSQIQPFRGVRFDPACAGNDPLSWCAPSPFDPRATSHRSALRERAPWSAVHLEGPDRAEIAGKWLSDGILVRDPLPVFYVYRQTFTATVAGVDGRFSRTGLVARVAPKAVLGTSTERRSESAGLPTLVHEPLAAVEGALRGPHSTTVKFLDGDSVEHTLQVVDDTEQIQALTLAFEGAEAVAVHGGFPSEGAPRMALLVASNDPGLILEPVHRVCRGVPRPAFDALVRSLSARHQVETFPYLGADAVDALLDSIPDDTLGFALRAKGSDEVVLVQIRADAHRRRALDSEVLRRELEAEFPTADTLSTTGGYEALHRLDSDAEASFAALSRPVQPQSLLRLAREGGVWDPDLAPLLPAPWTGLVMDMDS